MTDRRTVRFVVEAGDEALRLDQLIAHRTDLSRRKARLLLEIGGVFVERRRVKVAGRKLSVGQRVEVNVGGAIERVKPALGAAARAHDANRLPDYLVVFEDRHIVVVDKPSGLMTVPTPESDRGNLADLLARRVAPPVPVHVVHRLDLMTSGLLVYAKTPRASRVLAETFRAHDLDREYVGVVAGRFEATQHSERSPIGGKAACTHFTRREALGDVASVLGARLETGRTHQIRIHAARLGHAVLGDVEYGVRGSVWPPRMALHAERLGFAHPVLGTPLEFESPLPASLESWLDSLRAPPGV